VTTVTKGATTLTPTLVVDPSYTRTSGNIVHAILGRPAPDVTFAPARLRKGTHKFLCADRSAALALENLHATPGAITLVDPTIPGYGMKYVVEGEISSAVDTETRVRWIVDIGYQEVL
jgi:hypothetical protein